MKIRILRDDGQVAVVDPRDFGPDKGIAVTCQYAGQPYSEGSRVDQAGKTMECKPNPHDSSEGVWTEAS